MKSLQPFRSTIKLLSTAESGADRSLSGQFQSFKHKRLIFTGHQWLPVSSAVSLEYDDVLFVGEVLACQGEAYNTWKVLVQVQQQLNGLESLLHLRQQLLGTPVTPARFAPPERLQASLLNPLHPVLA